MKKVVVISLAMLMHVLPLFPFLGYGLGTVAAASATGQSPQEYVIKTAFIFNFTKFIQWPKRAVAGEGEPFVIGIFGEDPFQDTIMLLTHKYVANRPIIVRKIDKIAEANNCQILFVSASERYRFHKLLQEISGSVLTIGDSPKFLDAGGGINLIEIDKRIRFEVNVHLLEEAGFKISSHMLRLAHLIYLGE